MFDTEPEEVHMNGYGNYFGIFVAILVALALYFIFLAPHIH